MAESKYRLLSDGRLFVVAIETQDKESDKSEMMEIRVIKIISFAMSQKRYPGYICFKRHSRY